jgi:hypothetical protein
VAALELHPSRLQIDGVAATGQALEAAAAIAGGRGPKRAYLGGRDASLQVAVGMLDAGDGWLSEESSGRCAGGHLGPGWAVRSASVRLGPPWLEHVLAAASQH